MKYFILMTLILSVARAKAATIAVDLDASLKCLVVESSDPYVLLGASSREFSLRKLAENGLLSMSSGLPISLYSSLEIYDRGSPQSGRIVLSTKPTESKELHGSVFVNPKSEHDIDLEISVFQTTRVYDRSNGWPVFIFKNSPRLYKLKCERLGFEPRDAAHKVALRSINSVKPTGL